MAPMGRRFADVGAAEPLAKLWFASLLRDGIALTAAGGQEAFASLGRIVLRTLLTPLHPSGRLYRGVGEAIEHIMAGFGELPVHADVADGVRALRGSRRGAPMSARHGLAASTRETCCLLPCIPGTSTALLAPGCARRGSTEPAVPTLRTSRQRRSLRAVSLILPTSSLATLGLERPILASVRGALAPPWAASSTGRAADF